MKKLFLICAAAALSSPVRAQPPKYRIRWLLGHPNPDYFEEAALNFKSAVEKRTGGAVAVDIMTARFDGTESSPEAPEIPGKVASGEVEMGHSFVDVLGPVDPRMMVFEDPFLFRDYRHMEGVIEGPIGRELLAGLRARHLVGLSFTYSGGASGVAAVAREIRGPEDMKGLKVGVYGDQVNEAWLGALGASAVPIRHDLGGILPLASQGSLDAVVITWRNFQRAGLNDRFQFFNLPDSTYLVSVTYVNDQFFASLPQEYRRILAEESLKAGRIERAKTVELNENARAGMLAKGVVPVYLSETGRKRFAAALRPAYARIESRLGPSFVEKIRRTGDGPEFPSVPGDVASR